MSKLDEYKVHDLLHGIDHEEPGEDQDLGHGQPRVRERARLDGCGGDLNMIKLIYLQSKVDFRHNYCARNYNQY